ncbi:phosphoglycerate mutase family protein [Kibdelosporangium philippinense]|uniref:Phosphoglycerate mutase family protein n=1 Tax=Kibdelosporangium philippinense TaxID=211113 RepID=A0ABS8ZF90_9PSEU|nr:histidine phosphatase family protein [Kibdelosporangium philippinense]MCE7006484.1 phosphoglycerate mutase family protein [Kibdelosporangium philippinense]
MTRIWLIRHGQSRATPESRITGPATNPLTPLGFQQAAVVAEVFDHVPDLVVHSPYPRAQQTAQPTIERFPSARVEQWPIEEFTQVGRFDKPRADDARYWEAADPYYRDDPRSESFVDVYARARRFLVRLAETESSLVAAFTHGMFMRVVLWAILSGSEVPDSASMRRFHVFRKAIVIPNCSILPLVHSGKRGFQLRSASTTHLPASLQSGGR